MSNAARADSSATVLRIGDDGSEAGDGRQLRRQRNVRRVLDAAAELLEERRTVEMNDLVARSGTSYRSVYRYFGNIDHLVAEVADRRFSEARALLPTRSAATAVPPTPPTAVDDGSVRTLVARRVAAWRLVSPLLDQAGRQPGIRDQFVELDRCFRHDELRLASDRLAAVPDRSGRLAAIGVALRFDSIDALVRDERIDPAVLVDEMTATVERHLT